jgi:tetratricopeptide (TPR) repeat protein
MSFLVLVTHFKAQTMKKKIVMLIVLLSFSAGAKSVKKSFSEILEEKKYYYSALNEFFKETYSKLILKDDLSRLEELLYYTGIEILEDYDHQLLMKYPTSSTRFILGRRELQSKRYKKAMEFFEKVHQDHRYFPETKLLQAQIHWEEGKIKESFEAVDRCLSSSEKNESSAPSEKIKRYYRMAYEICLVNKARNLFKTGDYDASLDAYNKIPKVSYKWPYIILEKAWVYYQKGDFNRTLGLLVTYKSPLLDTYFFPEAEYLTALAYFRLCLYEDSLTVVNQYYQVYRPRFNALETVLRKNKSSQEYFYQMMFRPSEELKEHEFVKQIVTRMKKQIRFSLDFNSIHKINEEMRRIHDIENKAIKNNLLTHLAEVKVNMIEKINFNAKTDVFQFLQTVPFFSSELFKLNLEVLSRQKELVYSNRELVADRSRGDFSNVKRSRFEMFWTFHGAFWADELGDYSLGLKSSCQTIRKEAPEEKE